jgi:hypothetical protein
MESAPLMPRVKRLFDGIKRVSFLHCASRARACEDLLHASTSPQVETARAYELAKCRGNER